jgi:hypothetical protein
MANRPDYQPIVQVNVETHPPPVFGKETRLMLSARLSLSFETAFFVILESNIDVGNRKS